MKYISAPSSPVDGTDTSVYSYVPVETSSTLCIRFETCPSSTLSPLSVSPACSPLPKNPRKPRRPDSIASDIGLSESSDGFQEIVTERLPVLSARKSRLMLTLLFEFGLTVKVFGPPFMISRSSESRP